MIGHQMCFGKEIVKHFLFVIQISKEHSYQLNFSYTYLYTYKRLIPDVSSTKETYRFTGILSIQDTQ